MKNKLMKTSWLFPHWGLCTYVSDICIYLCSMHAQYHKTSNQGTCKHSPLKSQCHLYLLHTGQIPKGWILTVFKWLLLFLKCCICFKFLLKGHEPEHEQQVRHLQKLYMNKGCIIEIKLSQIWHIASLIYLSCKICQDTY